MTKIKDVISFLEDWAHPSLQEDYDNSGLITGNSDWVVKGALFSLDCTEEVVEEAIKKSCNLIVAHHPIVFKGLKKLTGSNYVERVIIKSIKNDIAIYAIHTNLDHVHTGVNHRISEKLGLKNTQILQPKKSTLEKLVVFVPFDDTQKVLDSLYKAGAGNIGNYKDCSFRVEGIGTFTPNEKANPYLGESNKPEEANENRVEILYPSFKRGNILKALRAAHPYEEIAYYISALENSNQEIGAGMIGELENEMEGQVFLSYLKDKMNLNVIRHTSLISKPIKKVAVCGGSGNFLLRAAISAGAQAFITADFKYHEFFDAENRLVIADIGHYESEIFTKELLYESITRKFTNIASYLSEVNTNPIKYFK